MEMPIFKKSENIKSWKSKHEKTKTENYFKRSRRWRRCRKRKRQSAADYRMGNKLF